MLLIQFRRTLSLNNLKTGLKGQVATFLMIIMVVVLMFILVTINIGDIAVESTRLSNAADSAALGLGSMLSTKSRALSNALDDACGSHDECCAKTGILPAVLAAIAAIILTLAGQPWWAIAVATALGAIGGLIVHGTGKGALQGAITGAIVGIAVAGGGTMAKDIFAGIIKTAVSSTLQAAGYSATLAIQIAEAAASMAAGTSVGTAVGAVGATLGAASSVYNEAVKQNMLGDFLEYVANSLSGMPEKDQFQESAIFEALSLSVTDPNARQDVLDTDGDGDRQEMVSAFQVWYYNRLQDLKGEMFNLRQFVREFRDILKDFGLEVGERIYGDGSEPCSGFLVRGEIEGRDGELVELLRALENMDPAIDIIPFWKEGPSQAELDLWYDCSDCPPPASYDEVDGTIAILTDLITKIDGVTQQKVKKLANTYKSWIKWFFEPDFERPDGTIEVRNADYYDRLYNLVYWTKADNDFYGIEQWISEIEAVRLDLDYCTYDAGLADNPPCRGNDTDPLDPLQFGGTIDADLDDEFAAVQNCLIDFIVRINQFRNNSEDYYDWIDDAANSDEEEEEEDNLCNPDPPRRNNVFYCWTDKQGDHSIQVEVGPFSVPDLDEESHGNFLVGEECIELDNKSDNISVTVTRYDPIHRRLQSGRRAIGWWNAFLNRINRGRISRTSVVHYSNREVEIVGR